MRRNTGVENAFLILSKKIIIYGICEQFSEYKTFDLKIRRIL